jgi:uncharacterized protein
METAGHLLRTAREKAGLSQAELASRAGTTQSVISVYEADRREPSLATLSSLVAATGYLLDVRLRRNARHAAMSGPIGVRVARQAAAAIRIAGKYQVRLLGVFGSVARGQDGPDSDLDLLVELPASMSILTLGRLTAELEKLLDVRVDLVPASDLKPSVRPQVMADLVRL